MGTELMEETKRRQALEAEVQELRMRVSGVEAVARSPVVAPGSAAAFPLPTPGYSDPLSAGGVGAFPGGTCASHGYAPPSACCGGGAAAGGGAPYDNSAEAAAYAAAAGLSGVESLGVGDLGYGADPASVYGATSSDAYGMCRAAYAATAPPALPAMTPAAVASAAAMSAGVLPSSAADGSADDSDEAKLARAVDSKLKDLVPAIHAVSVVHAAATAPPGSLGLDSAGRGGEASASAPMSGRAGGGSEFGLPQPGSGAQRRSGAAALRISRQELDSRVQQILGRHGQALAELGGGTPKPR